MEHLLKYGDRVRTHAVEVKLENTTGKYFLPDDSILRNKKVFDVFVQDNPNDDMHAPGTDRDLAAQVVIRNAYLTLVCNATQMLSDHPLVDLTVSLTDKKHRPVMVPEITPSKSYILVADASNNVTTGESIVLHFTYLD